VRIAIDIDSTLHPYWDQLAAVAKRRFGIELPYEDQVRCCVDETHREPLVLAAEPYPGAVEAVRAWHEQGHFIHVTSHRAPAACAATARWLERIGLPFDDLHCSSDKVSRCIELGIDVLIDDSPENLVRAADAGITVATIAHPWNRDVCEEEDVICAADWPTLAERLEPVLVAA
jgi:uncharacterized protein